MKETREVIEDTGSIQNVVYVYICAEEERENILTMIKEKHKGLDIELIKNGYRVREIRKKTEAERSEWAKNHKPPSKVNNSEWQDGVNQLKNGKRK